MEGQTQDSEATPHLPRHPRQYQAEVREASIDELAHDDLYGGGNQPRHATLSPEGEEAKDAKNSQWIADYITEEPIDFAQELESTSAGHQQPTTMRNDSRSWRHSRRPSRPQPKNTSRVEPGTNSSRNELALRFELPRPVSTPEESESSIITEDFSESERSSSEEDTPPRDPPLLQPNRYAIHPVDIEGNRLSFQVQTKPSSSSIAPSEESDKPENKEGLGAEKKEPGDKNLEIRRIIRAMAIESDAQDMLEIHTLPSLASPRLRTSITTTWYHLNGSHLDFDRFENVCLTIPHLSDRLQALTREVLLKLRGERIKPFVGGRFIEPGTVLRADESDPTDTQSVIFSCVPYFSTQQVAKPPHGHGDLLCPSRTLMQALYPYESVHERDEEQSYKRFGNDHANNIVHVPNLWIMNIGSTAVVTYGCEPLPVAVKDSISIIEEDLRSLGKQDTTENTLTKVHITDRNGSSLIYPISAFRSYFQLESQIVHVNPLLEEDIFGKGIKLKVHNLDECMIARPWNWKNIISRAAQLVSIRVTILDNQEDDQREVEASSCLLSVPPFFHWLHSKTNDLGYRSGKLVVPGISGKDRSIICLQYVEKIMMSRCLARSSNIVEDHFTSIAYYHSLPETVYEGVSMRLSQLKDLIDTTTPQNPCSINHKVIVSSHCRGVLVRSVDFLETVQETLKLFVDDLDSSSILRKLSSALQNIHQQVMAIERRGAVEPDPEEYTNSKWKHPDMMKRAWSIRTSAWEVPSTLPESIKPLHRSVLRCKRCKSAFQSATSAMTHLVRHVKKHSSGNAHPEIDIPSFEELQDWIINSVQYRRELINASALVILTHASEIAKGLFAQARELAEGVQNEDGQKYLLYTLPQELINAFRRIVIFYLAIERALYENEQAYRQDVRDQSSHRLMNAPYPWRDVEVLKRFGGYARRSLCKARILLCDMVRPRVPPSLRKHLSLGPEYVCLWFIRRLLMKPLEQSKTIGDMYHAYVSKVQFEINHRPSKRLLRAINFIQEELQVLQLVNTWQTNLVRNYLRVLDDATYEKAMPSRRAMYPYENSLGAACLDQLSLVRQDYSDLFRRCTPLSDRTKQILEINEEDHGKAIMVFTVVTVIFLPLSFVTSYFGMNASDIRDMKETQAVFWGVALPLTCVTLGSCLLIGYNGDRIRDLLSSTYRKVTRKEDDTVEAASILFSQRQGPLRSERGLDSVFDSFRRANDELPSLRRGLYRAGHDLGMEPDDNEYDGWFEKENPKLLDQYNTLSYLHNPSTYPSGVAPKRQNSYANPMSVVIQPRRQSQYPYSYPSDGRPFLNGYDRVPYEAYEDVSRDYHPTPPPRPPRKEKVPPHEDYHRAPCQTYRDVLRNHRSPPSPSPPQKERTKSGYTNRSSSIDPINFTDLFDPYSDGDSPKRLPEMSYHRPPPRRVSTSGGATRSPRRYFDRDGIELFIRDRDTEKEYAFEGRHDRSRTRSRSHERDHTRHVHYERKRAGRAGYDGTDEHGVPHAAGSASRFTWGRRRQEDDSPDEDIDPYDADKVSRRRRRTTNQEYESREEDFARQYR